jgi:hypothetical protein
MLDRSSSGTATTITAVAATAISSPTDVSTNPTAASVAVAVVTTFADTAVSAIAAAAIIAATTTVDITAPAAVSAATVIAIDLHATAHPQATIIACFSGNLLICINTTTVSSITV